jgi:hypothetical protein
VQPVFVEPVVLLNRNELNHLRWVEINMMMGLHLADLAAETPTPQAGRQHQKCVGSLFFPTIDSRNNDR